MTGLLGGTFNPPHNGHLALARGAIEHFGLERLVVLVAGQAPHKLVDVDGETRYRLARAAFADLPRVELSRFELDRDGPAYTLETVRHARREWGEIVFLVGADQFEQFLGWKEPDGILELARLGVGSRPGYPAERLEPVLAGLRAPERVEFFEIEAVPVSSREIRERVAVGEPIDALVPAGVAREIEALGLYRAD